MARGGWWGVSVCLVIGSLFASTPANAGFFTVTLAGGSADSATPSVSQQFQYDPGDGGGLLGLTQFSADGSFKASNAGGNVFFTGGALPVLFSLDDGNSYIASTGAPADVSSVVGDGSSGTVAPAAGATLPTSAALLSVSVSPTSEDDGTRTITASITDALLNPLGSTSITLSGDSWWVLGLSPVINTDPDPDPEPDPDPVPDPDPDPVPDPEPDPGTDPGATTPEPSTLAMAALGLGGLGWWRRKRSA